MYCAYVVEVKNLRKHSNADRLLCTEVFGNNVIVTKDYFEGMKCIFFPVDGQIGLEYARKNNLLRRNENGVNVGGYLDAEKRNVKAVKLRGEFSEGLLLPIESLSDYTDVSQLKVGDQITVLNGTVICEKYIPHRHEIKSGSNSSKRIRKKNKKLESQVSYPLFAEHVDTAQLAYNLCAFHEGDTVYLTLKMHGTSARTGITRRVTTKYPNFIKKLFGCKPITTEDWVDVSGTRRVTLDNYDGGYYSSNVFRKQYHDFFKDKLPKGFEVFYEIVGYVDGTEKPIMPKCDNKAVKDKEFEKQYGKETVFNYGCEVGKSDFYVYRITFTNEDGVVTEIPWEVTKLWCEKMGLQACN